MELIGQGEDTGRQVGLASGLDGGAEHSLECDRRGVSVVLRFPDP